MSAPNSHTAPKVGESIVWRFKGNHGWRRSYVRAHYAKGKVIELVNGGTMGDEIVAVADIEWHIA